MYCIMKKIIFMISLGLLSQVAMAENWQKVIGDNEGAYFLDKSSVRTVAAGKAYVAKYVFDKDSEEYEAKKNDYIVSNNIDNCEDNTTVTVSAENFTAKGVSGGREEYDADDVSDVSEDEVNQAFFDKVCGR